MKLQFNEDESAMLVHNLKAYDELLNAMYKATHRKEFVLARTELAALRIVIQAQYPNDKSI